MIKDAIKSIMISLLLILFLWLASVSTTSSMINLDSNSNAKTTGSLQIIKIVDVTTDSKGFAARNEDFVSSLSELHDLSNDDLNWHLMSGSAAFIPSLKVNILTERLFYNIDPKDGHHSSVECSFILCTPWAKDWTKQVGLGVVLRENEEMIRYYSRQFEGPEDARIIYNQEKDEINLNYNALTPIGDRQMFSSSIKFYREGHAIKSKTKESLVHLKHRKGYRAKTEKNWTPILIKDELYYVYSLFPLRIIKCDPKFVANNSSDDLKSGVCTVKFGGKIVSNDAQTGSLRGGTNWIEHSPGVYFSLGRTRITHRKCQFAIYRPNLVVLKFKIDPNTAEYSNPKKISFSSAITKFDKALFDLYAKKRPTIDDKCDDEAILTPGSISQWTGMSAADVADVVISVNDDMNVMLRIKGFGRAVQNVLDSLKYSMVVKNDTSVDEAARDLANYVNKTF